MWLSKRQDGGRSPAITISTLAEARYFFGHDITDILYAVGIAPVKLLQAVWDRVKGW
jgi:D-serine deaminase-like pyridoxal phosphate-dependent protein